MIFIFDVFELDEDCLELRHGNEVVPLQPRVLEMLIYLVKNRSRLVTKEALSKGPWKGTPVADATLHQAVFTMRAAFSSRGGRTSELIKTVRGRGFRFVGAVTERTSHACDTKAERPSGRKRKN